MPSIGLGSIAVSPLDLASAYATLAAGGVHAEPMAIRRVVLADGREDTDAGWGVPKRERAISEGDGGDRHAHPRAERPVGNGHARRVRPAGGRQDGDERGARRRLVRRVHARARDDRLDGLHDAPRSRCESVHGIAVSGGSFPAEIWRLFMEPALEGTEPAAFSGAGRVAGVEAVHARRVRADVRPDDARAGDDDRPRPRRESAGAADAAAAGAGPLVAIDVAELLTVDDALARILERARLLPTETRRRRAARPDACCASRRLRGVDLPPFPSSAMDGFAVRAAETPGELPVAFRVAAGSAAARRRSRRVRPRGSRRAARCPTAPTRSCRSSGRRGPRDRVEFADDATAAGQHVRPRGGDVRAGDVVVDAGHAARRRADRRAWPPPVWPTSRARYGLGSRCSRRAASCELPATCSRRVRSTSRTER